MDHAENILEGRTTSVSMLKEGDCGGIFCFDLLGNLEMGKRKKQRDLKPSNLS